MDGVCTPSGGSTIKVAARSVSKPESDNDEQNSPDQTVSDWFVDMAQALLSKDAGFALSRITGFEERTCYRYASGARKPPAYFLRALLRSEQGGPFLSAVMSGSTAQWWRDLQHESEVGRKVLIAIK